MRTWKLRLYWALLVGDKGDAPPRPLEASNHIPSRIGPDIHDFISSARLPTLLLIRSKPNIVKIRVECFRAWSNASAL